MAFQIRPLKEFLVRPALPPALSRLSEIGVNIYWSWDHNLRALFRRLDPVLWKASNHNPVVMLGRLPQSTLERAASDPRFLMLYRRACETLDAYLAAAKAAPSNMLVAYFSMEYGLLDCMPIYSGGLGVLSGDHLKASSDAMLPLVGVGLLYQKGYLQQTLGPDGWQHERTPVNDFYSLPVTPETRADGSELLVSVTLAGTPVFLKVWRIDVGRVKLYLLDSNIPQNARAEHREITNQLYGGDRHTRIRQEIALGIGGLRALKELGLQPTVYHMNEGHSAFLALERIRVLMSRAAAELRGSAGRLAYQQRVHHAHLGAGRDRPVRRRASCTSIFRITATTPELRSTSCCRSAAAIRTMRRSRFRWRWRRSRRPPSAMRSAACIATFRSRCGTDCGPSCRCGKCRSRPSPTACICPPGSTGTWPGSTISICSRTGAKAMPNPRSGTRSPRSPTPSCGKRIAAANAG